MRKEFPRKVKAAAIFEREPRAKSKNFKWIEEIVASPWPARCIEWPYAKRANGYGTIFRKGKRTSANRVVCELAHGEPPSVRMHAAHTCGNRSCVNPAHLAWKTILDNHADKRIHGTHRQGEEMPWSKLTERSVREIKERLLCGESGAALARCFNVSASAISDINVSRTWRHVPW